MANTKKSAKKPPVSVPLVGGCYRASAGIGQMTLFLVEHKNKPIKISALEKKFPDLDVPNRLQSIAAKGKETKKWDVKREDDSVRFIPKGKIA